MQVQDSANTLYMCGRHSIGQIHEELDTMKINAQATSLRIRKPRSMMNALNLVPLKHDLDLIYHDVDEVCPPNTLCSHTHLVYARLSE